MRQATQHEGRPLTGAEVVDERGDGRTTGFESEVMHGADGFVGDERRLVLHETGGGSIITTTQGDDRGETHGNVVILGDGIEDGGVLAEMVDGEGTGMTEHRVGISVLLEHREDFRESLVGAETSRGDGGEGAHAGGGIEDQLAERQVVTLERGFFQGADGLGADFGVGVREQRDETTGGGGARFEGSHRGRALPGTTGSDGRATTGEDTETPDAVDAFEGVGGLGGGLKAVRGVRTAGEFDLGAQADALVGVREERGEFGGRGLGDAAVDERGHRGDGVRLHHLAGLEGHETSGLVGFPAGDEVGDDEASLPVILDVGRGDAPEQLVRGGHLHAGARGLHLEGPDTGRARGTAVVADVEMTGFGFEEARAGVIGQAGRTGADVSGGRDDEGRLGRVLEFPDLLGHPARQRALLEADRSVESVHGLVLHFPAGVGALDDVDHAGGVALVGIIVDGEGVAEVVEGDLLRVTQAEVDDLEVRAVGFETEDRAAVTGVILLPFLGGEVEATVADGTPDAAVRTDGETVHVVTGKRDAHAEAVFDDLAARFDAVLLGVVQHPEFRNAGEVDRIVPGHDARAGAVEDVIEAAREDLVRGERAVGLLAADVADELGLGGHPFMRALGFPLLVQGDPVGGGDRGEVVVIPVEVVTVVFDAEAEAMRLGDVDRAVVAEADRGRRGDAGDLAVGSRLEGGARDERGAAFAGHAHEAAVRLRLRAAACRELRLGVIGEDKVVRGDETPGAGFIIDDADDAGLALELRDVPDGLAQGQVIGTGRLPDDLAADEELDGGLAGVVAARDEEAELGRREFDLGRGQRTGGGVAA